MPLIDTVVRQAKPADRSFTLTDASGLSLYVAPNGTKSWHFRFSWHGKQPRMSLGTYNHAEYVEQRRGQQGTGQPELRGSGCVGHRRPVERGHVDWWRVA